MNAELDETVAEIVDLMTKGLWFPGRSDREFAKSRQVPLSTVRNWTSQASRFIRLTMCTDREEIRTRIFAGIEGIRALALSRRRFQDVYEDQIETDADGKERRRSHRKTENVADPALTEALKAYEVQARLFGLLQPEYIQPPKNALDDMTDEQLEQFAKSGDISAILTSAEETIARGNGASGANGSNGGNGVH